MPISKLTCIIYIACSCDGWRGMSYNELLILHMQVPEAVFAIQLINTRFGLH